MEGNDVYVIDGELLGILLGEVDGSIEGDLLGLDDAAIDGKPVGETLGF